MKKEQAKYQPYNLNLLFEEIKDSLNKELKSKGFKAIGAKTFRKIIKHYFRHITDRVIYKYQTVEMYKGFGTLTGHKILCTEFNPERIDVNKTDGYYYFLFWRRPVMYVRWKFGIPAIWKKRLYQNVVVNGGDYPEINEKTYGIY